MSIQTKPVPDTEEKLLISYSNGLIVCWNVLQKKVEDKHTQALQGANILTYACWAPNAKKIMAGFSNGK
jgi:hypothetical protein